MAFFSSEESLTRLNEYAIIPYVHKKDSVTHEIISYYEGVNNSAYQHYASEWRKIDLDIVDKGQKQQIFDLICAAIIDDNDTIKKMCKADVDKLTQEDNVIPFDDYDFALKMTYSDYWPSNTVRLKAYSDIKSGFYKNGKLSNFEYYLRSIYRQKILSGEYDVRLASSGYERDISIYRDTYFKALNTDMPENGFYLPVLQELDNFNYELADDIISQATEDASSGTAELNYNFFISFQSYFNKMISKYALQIKESTYSLTSTEIKNIMQSAKLNEIEYLNRYSELFNLYVSTYNQIHRKYALLTSMEDKDVKLPVVDDYKLNTFFDEVEETFEDVLHTSLHEMVKQSIAYYEKTDKDDYILSTENQIRNYYQEQLSKLYLGSKNGIKYSEIQKLEIPVLEEYKEKIDEFRNACMRKISYSFARDYPPINKYVDYSFNIGESFEGLDKRTVIEWAMQAAKNADLSLHSIKLIKLKIGEFININCLNGDTSSHKEVFGSHEKSVIMERFAMIENRLLVFGESLCEVYLQYLKRYYIGDIHSDDWKVFSVKADDLIAEPLTTYYDTSFDVASVENQAQEDKEHYSLGTETPYYIKMKNMVQQKVFDLNDAYAKEIEIAKEEYVVTGKKVNLNLIINNLRIDIDRIVDEHLNLVNYYVKEFEEKNIEIKDEFDKGPYYSFQSDTIIAEEQV